MRPSVYAQTQDEFVTRKLGPTISGFAEDGSFMQFNVERSGTYISYDSFTNSQEGSFSRIVRLGNNIDTGGCVKVINKRKTGICEDGLYKVIILSTDEAGNKSFAKTVSIERDTVAPDQPKVLNTYACGSSICITVSAEPATKLWANSKVLGTIPASGETSFALLSHFQFNTTYKFAVALIDKAGNASESVSVIFTSPKTAFGQGGLPEAGEDKPYGDESVDKLGNISMDIEIYDGTDEYHISNVHIPKPILTYSQSTPEDTVRVYGVAIPKHHTIQVNASLAYATFNQAWDWCKVGIWVSWSDKDCMEEKMHIDSYDMWLLSRLWECKSLIPFAQFNCFQNLKANWREKESTQTTIQAEHVMLALHKNDAQNTYLQQIWNDNPTGTFNFTQPLDSNLHIGDYVTARVTIFGETTIFGHTVSYARIDQSQSTSDGLRSDFADQIEISPSDWSLIAGEWAKVLDVPYFNQYLEPDGSFHPPDGWQMCGAASVVMVAGYYNKLPYDHNDPHSLKKYMYSDAGQGISETCGIDKGGAFGLTNIWCNQSYNGGLVKYLKRMGLEYEFISGYGVSEDGFPLYDSGSITFEKIKSAIDSGSPVVVSIEGHIFTYIGYTKSGLLIANDSWKDQSNDFDYSYNGGKAIYYLDQFEYSYAIKVFQ